MPKCTTFVRVFQQLNTSLVYFLIILSKILLKSILKMDYNIIRYIGVFIASISLFPKINQIIKTQQV